MSIREHQNYFGQTATPFVIVSEFALTDKNLKIVFDGYASTESFDAGDEPLPILRREFFIDGNEFKNLQDIHTEIFDSIKARTLEIAQSPANYVLTNLQLFISKWVLVIQATRNSKDDSIIRTKTAPEYHQIIAENLELVSQVLTVAWQYGKEKDEWLKCLNSISELKY